MELLEILLGHDLGDAALEEQRQRVLRLVAFLEVALAGVERVLGRLLHLWGRGVGSGRVRHQLLRSTAGTVSLPAKRSGQLLLAAGPASSPSASSSE